MFDFFNSKEFLDFIQSIALLSLSVGLLMAQRAHFMLNKKLDNLHRRLKLLGNAMDDTQKLIDTIEQNKDIPS